MFHRQMKLENYLINAAVALKKGVVRMKWFFSVLTGLSVALAVSVPMFLSSQGYAGIGLTMIFLGFMGLFLLGLLGSVLVKGKTPKKYNKRAAAEILEAEQTGMYRNNQPQLAITLSYFTENGQKVVTVLRKVVSFADLALVRPGVIIDILYQEDKPQKVEIASQEREENFETDSGEFDFVAKEKRWSKVHVFVGIIAVILGFIGIFGGLTITFLENRMGIFDFVLLTLGVVVIVLGVACIQNRYRTMTVICLIGMVVLLGVSGYLIGDIYNEYQATEAATATVLNEYPTNYSVNDVPQRKAKLEYLTKDGQKITTTTNSTNANEAGVYLEEGRKVTIYYNPVKPKKVYFTKKSEEVRKPLLYKLYDR